MQQRRIAISIGLFSLGFLTCGADAQPVALSVDFPQNELSSTATETFPGSNVWDFEVFAPNSTQVTANEIAIRVTADSELAIRDLDILGGAGLKMVRIEVVGIDSKTQDVLIDDLDFLDFSDAASSDTALDLLDIDGDVLLITGMNEVGTVRLRNGDLGKLVVESSPQGPMSIPPVFGGAVTIDVSGSIGLSGAVQDPGVLIEEGSLGLLSAGGLGGTVSVEDTIFELEVSGNSGATITTTEFDEGAGLGSIYRLNVAGNFVGNIETGAFVSEGPEPILLEIGGNFQTSQGSFDTRTIRIQSALPSSGTYSIGGAFGPYAEIVLPDQGLASQFVINRENIETSAGDAWDADPPNNADPGRFVFDEGGANELIIAAADYEEPPTALGGGSVGAAPYRVNDPLSDPVNGFSDVRTGSQPALTEAEAAYYGPLAIQSGMDAVSVERKVHRVSGGPAPFNPVHGADFEGSIVSGTDDRNLLVTDANGVDFEWGYTYRISPGPGLQSAGTANLPAPEEVYEFTIGFDCPTDLLDGANPDTADPYDAPYTGSEDLGSLLSSYGPVDPGHPADFNDDQVVNATDLGVLIAAWGPCENLGGGSIVTGAGGREVGDASTAAGGGLDAGAIAQTVGGGEQSASTVLDALGFETIDAYIVFLESLNETELAAHFVELLEIVENL